MGRSATNRRAETRLQKGILQALKTIPECLAWRANAGLIETKSGAHVTLAPTGTPDIIGVIGPAGLFFGLEVKRPDDPSSELSDGQHKRHDELRARGALIATVRGAGEAVAIVKVWAALSRERKKRSE